MSDIIKIGLRQMGLEALQRLKAYIEAGKPLCLTGDYWSGSDP